MLSAFISRIMILIFGVLHPAYCSYKAIRTKNIKEYVDWMMYWVVYALFTFVETITDIFISWFPFYFEAKMIFILYLTLPMTRGGPSMYRKFIHPILSQKEPEIDACIANAKEKGYLTFLQLGSQGIRFASETIVQSAAKCIPNSLSEYALNTLSDGGTNHIRRSQSNDTVDRGLDAVELSDDDDTDTCARSRGAIKRKPTRKVSTRSSGARARRNIRNMDVDIDI